MTTLFSFDSTDCPVRVPPNGHPDILEVSGSDALDFLHRLSTNNLLNLPTGKSCDTVFTNEKGRILDHVLVARSEDRILLLTSPNTGNRLHEWLDKYTIMDDVHCENKTGRYAITVFVGKNTFPHFQDLVKVEVTANEVKEIHRREGTDILVCAKAFGLEWAYWCGSSLELPDQNTIPMLSPAVWESARIIHGIPSGGHELDNRFNPYEVWLRGAISFSKGCYIGQEVIARLDTYQKVQRQLVRIWMSIQHDLTVPCVVVKDGAEVGWITSIAQHEIGGRTPGLAVLRKEILRGEKLQVMSSLPTTVEVEGVPEWAT